MIKPTPAIAALVAVGVWLTPGTGETSYLMEVFTPPTNTASPCLEDEPCWQWWTMGNRCHGLPNGLVECVTRVDTLGNAYSDVFESDTGAYVGGYN